MVHKETILVRHCDSQMQCCDLKSKDNLHNEIERAEQRQGGLSAMSCCIDSGFWKWQQAMSDGHTHLGANCLFIHKCFRNNDGKKWDESEMGRIQAASAARAASKWSWAVTFFCQCCHVARHTRNVSTDCKLLLLTRHRWTWDNCGTSTCWRKRH